MCVMSMVMGRSNDWMREYQPPIAPPFNPYTPYPSLTPPKPNPIFTQDMADFVTKMIGAAKQYDTKTGQPDCELGEKREEIRKHAERLGVKINFE